MSAGIRRDERDDSGFTLIELIISIGLMVVVAALAGSILITTFTGQQKITGSATGSNNGLVVAQSLSKGVRSATAVHVTVISASREFLQVATPGTGAVASTKCQAWFFTTENGGAVYTTTSSTAIAAPTADSVTGWLKLADGVAKSVRSGAPASILTASGSPAKSVAYEFAIAGGAGKPQLFASSITSRQPITSAGSTACA